MDALFNFYKSALSGGGITTPLCAEYKAAWRACGNDKKKLVSLSLAQQAIPYVATFAYQGLGITKDYVKENFADFINGVVLNDCDAVKGYTYQLWVDAPTSQEIGQISDVSHFMWSRNVDVTIQETKCPTIYVSNNSNINVTLSGHNTIRIYLLDDSVVHIDDADETCSVLVYRYSKQARVIRGKYCLCDVKVFDKELRL